MRIKGERNWQRKAGDELLKGMSNQDRMCPAESWNHVMDAEMAMKNAQFFSWFLRIVSVIGLLGIVVVTYNIATVGVEPRFLLGMQMAILISGMGFIMDEPARTSYQSFVDLEKNNGWMNTNSNPQMGITLGIRFIIISTIIVFIGLTAVIIEQSDPRMHLFVLFPILGIYFYFAGKKELVGPISYVGYYRITFNEAVDLLYAQKTKLFRYKEYQVKRKKITICGDDETIVGSISSIDCFTVQVTTPHGNEEQNRRLRENVAAILLGCPLPEAADGGAEPGDGDGRDPATDIGMQEANDLKV